MWKYRTNIMGPMTHWYEKNKIPYTEEAYYSKLLDKDCIRRKYETDYYGGRIDCYCHDNPNDPEYDPYGREQALPIVEASILQEIDTFLDDYITDQYDPDVLRTFSLVTGIQIPKEYTCN